MNLILFIFYNVISMNMEEDISITNVEIHC